MTLHTPFNGPQHQPFAMGEGATGVLLIHGFPGTPAEMRPLGTTLAIHGYSAHGILLPGFGPQIGRLGQTNPAIWLEAAREAWWQVKEQYETAVLAGFSLGAAIAIHLAVTHPPHRLVLLAPFWRLDSWLFKLLPLLKHILPTAAPFANVDFSDPAVRKQVKELVPGVDLDDPEMQRYLREQIRVPTALVDDIRRFGRSAYQQASQVVVPTLVLQGTEDETVAPANTRRLLAQFGGPVTYHEFPATHNFPKMEAGQSGRFTQPILSFLANDIYKSHIPLDMDT